VVIGTDCGGSGKSNYHKITTTMAAYKKKGCAKKKLNMYNEVVTNLLYSASSLKQQSMDRHVTPLRHIILVPTSHCSYSLKLHA
jgi:hypothetical protein